MEADGRQGESQEEAEVRKDFELWKKDADTIPYRRWLPSAVVVMIIVAGWMNALESDIGSILSLPFFPVFQLKDRRAFDVAFPALGTFYAFLLHVGILKLAKRWWGPKPFQQTYCVKAFHNQVHFDYFAKGETDDSVDLDTEIKRLLAVYKFRAGDATNARQQILELEDQINFHVFKTVKGKVWPHPFSLKLVHFDTDTTKPKTETHADSQPRNVIILS